MTAPIERPSPGEDDRLPRLLPGSALTDFPPPELWDDWVEYDAKAWPERVQRNYRLVPTTCFNCEAACGLLAYVDKDTGKVRPVEVGQETGNRIEVLSGLAPGDQVVVRGNERLRPDQPVQVQGAEG